MSLLSTDGLSKRYGGLLAVNDVSFTVPEGQLRAVIGPNGAGKSTFVGMLCGRIESSSGSVMFDNRDITALAAHQRISLGMAYTFQITSVFARLSLHENVALAIRQRHKGTTKQTHQRVIAALEQVGLAEKSQQLAGDMAYGHQRLLEIAMGLAQSPRLFILDEPTQGLAESEIDEFKKLMKSMSGSTTILLIEHNMSVVMETADYITVLNAGETLAEGTPDAIRANGDVQSAYLGQAAHA